MHKLTKILLLAISASAPAAALAHEGHGIEGIWHSLSLVHFAPVAAGLIVALVIARHLWSRSQR